MELIQSLTAIEKLAAEKEAENDLFRQFLKEENPVTIDAHIAFLNKSISPQIDCTACGNCCRNLMINIEDAYVKKLADRLNLTEAMFLHRYVEKGETLMIFNQVPCHFLQDCKCTVYEDRPVDCRRFPNLDEPGFQTRLFASFSHYRICPIIFNVLEGLKTSMGFTSKGLDEE